MSPSLVVFTLLVVLGGAVGSFVNVCVYRIPRGISLISPRSFCPYCRRPLRWYELVPIMSFLIQKGRCRTCGSAVSLQYPLVEIIFATAFVVCYVVHGPSTEFAMCFGFITLMVPVAIVDWRHFIIPNTVVVTGVLIGFVFRNVLMYDDLLQDFVATGSGVGTMLLIRLSGNFVFRKETMGMGDVKLGGLVSLFLGFEGFVAAVWIAAMIGGMYALSCFWSSRFPANTLPGGAVPIPFGSFLAVASCFVLLFGDLVLNLAQTWLISIQ